MSPAKYKARDAVGAVTLHTLISAATYLVAKGTLLALGPFETGFFRFTLATAVMFLIARKRPSFPGLGRRWQLLVLGFLAIPANQVLFLIGIGLSTPTHAALLYSLTPVVVLAVSLALSRESLDARRVTGMAMAMAGVTWVLTEKGLDLSAGPLRGDLVLGVAVVGWSLFSVFGKPWSTRYGAVPVTAWSFIWGTLLYAPLGLWFVRSLDWGAVPAAAWGGVVYLAIPTSVIAYVLWNWALKWLDATQVAIFTSLQPPLTAVLSAIIFKEEMTTGLVIGGLLTLAGVTLTNLKRPRPRHPSPA